MLFYRLCFLEYSMYVYTVVPVCILMLMEWNSEASDRLPLWLWAFGDRMTTAIILNHTTLILKPFQKYHSGDDLQALTVTFILKKVIIYQESVFYKHILFKII